MTSYVKLDANQPFDLIVERQTDDEAGFGEVLRSHDQLVIQMKEKMEALIPADPEPSETEAVPA